MIRIDHKFNLFKQQTAITMRGSCDALFALLILIAFKTWDPPLQEEHKNRGQTVRRCHRTASNIIWDQGAHARRACRMESTSFWEMHRILLPLLKRRSRGTKRKRGKTPNGKIAASARLSMTLRCFHGVSHCEVFRSVWTVVDAVNRCDLLAMTFPACPMEQQQHAAEFCAAGGAGMRTCLATTDGLLVWTNKPGPADCELTGCGPTKLMCGRKHKFGLNMQGTCALRGKFLDLSIAKTPLSRQVGFQEITIEGL
jgi:hypothetical protein